MPRDKNGKYYYNWRGDHQLGNVIQEFKDLGGQLIGDLFNQDTFRTQLGQLVGANEWTSAGANEKIVDYEIKEDKGKKIKGDKRAIIHESAGGQPHQTTYPDRSHPQGEQIPVKSMGNGYCAGVCMDWIRRVILGGVNRDPSDLSYHSGALKRKEATKNKDGSTRSVEQGKERAFDTVGRMGDAWVQMTELGWYRPGGRGHERDPESHRPEEWSGTAQNKGAAQKLDEAFDRARTAVDRAPTTRPFSDLVMHASKNHVYPCAGRQWITEVMANGLRPFMASKLGFGIKGVAGRHAVVVWQREMADSPNAFYLFDPNIGVFAFGRDKLTLALMNLFWVDRVNTPYYWELASATSAEVNYVIFGRPLPTTRRTPLATETLPQQLAKATAARDARMTEAILQQMPGPKGLGGIKPQLEFGKPLRATTTPSYAPVNTGLITPGLPVKTPATATTPATAATAATAPKPLTAAQKARVKTILSTLLTDQKGATVELTSDVVTVIERLYPGAQTRGVVTSSGGKLLIKRDVLQKIKDSKHLQ
jgi:hypothetical protein